MCVSACDMRERERQTDRDRETERQRQRQRDRHRETERETDRQRHRETETDTETERHTETHTRRENYRFDFVVVSHLLRSAFHLPTFRAPSLAHLRRLLADRISLTTRRLLTLLDQRFISPCTTSGVFLTVLSPAKALKLECRFFGGVVEG